MWEISSFLQPVHLQAARQVGNATTYWCVPEILICVNPSSPTGICAGKICVNLEPEPRHSWTAPARWLAYHMLSTQTRKKDFLQFCLLTAMVKY